MTDVHRDTLKDLVDRAVLGADFPHMDLGPLLGIPKPIKVGVYDMLAIVQSGEPAFRIEVGDGWLTVRRENGGMMTTLELKF